MSATNDGKSFVISSASTLVPAEDGLRTTLHGKPINYEHDNVSSMILGDGGGFASGAGANTLPPGYTDRSLVRIPIRISDLETSQKEPKRKRNLLQRLISGGNEPDDIKVVMMTRADYLQYWAKGEDGKFLPSVVEPEEGRAEWVRKQLELNEEWKKQNPLLGAKSPRMSASDMLAGGLTGSMQ